MTLHSFDLRAIHFFRRISVPFARVGLCVIFFWFGILKVIGVSPAQGVVQRLFEQTIPFMSFSLFFILFGLFECAIGLLFLFKGKERVVIPLLLLHMIATCGPLVLLPGETWTAPFIPTLEGQYIIKNLAIMAAAVGIASHLHPLKRA